MGYESSLHLIDVKIKPASVGPVSRTLKTPAGRGTIRLRHFLERAVIDCEGFLQFKGSEDGGDPYVPDADDGTVPAVYGKWYDAERFARWLKRHSARGGRIVLHSIEGDGNAWGWEFDGRGRMRPLHLRSSGRWEW
jgi:hypothetical protein